MSIKFNNNNLDFYADFDGSNFGIYNHATNMWLETVKTAHVGYDAIHLINMDSIQLEKKLRNYIWFKISVPIFIKLFVDLYNRLIMQFRLMHDTENLEKLESFFS